MAGSNSNVPSRTGRSIWCHKWDKLLVLFPVIAAHFNKCLQFHIDDVRYNIVPIVREFSLIMPSEVNLVDLQLIRWS